MDTITKQEQVEVPPLIEETPQQTLERVLKELDLDSPEAVARRLRDAGVSFACRMNSSNCPIAQFINQRTGGIAYVSSYDVVGWINGNRVKAELPDAASQFVCLFDTGRIF